MAKTTYKQLIEVLHGLGFERKPTAGGHLYFQHLPTKSIVALPPAKMSDVVSPAHLAAVRMTLIGRNVARQDAVDELLGRTRRQSA